MRNKTWLPLATLLLCAVGVQCGNDSETAAPDKPDAGSIVDASNGDVAKDSSAEAAGDGSIEPSTGDGPRMFIPRIATSDGAIWNHRQRAAILWFGRVATRDDYVDVRAGARDDLLMIHAAVFDREIHDDAPDDALDAWDSLTFLLARGDELGADSLRVDAQAGRHGTARTVVYRGAGGTWQKSQNAVGGATDDLGTHDLVVVKGYRGSDDRDESRGWHVTLYVRWSALGFEGYPGQTDRELRVGLIQHDRDDADGSLRGAAQHWPEDSLDENDPETWGTWEILDASFLGWEESGSTAGNGRASYSIKHDPEPYVPGTERTIVIREGLEGQHTLARSVGASEVLCSGDDDYNFGEGASSWGGNTESSYFHVQNQEDYADWPCFSKIYLKFPLDLLPSNSVVVSALLRLHHKEPTSGGDEGARSLIQAFHVSNSLHGTSTPWDEDNLTWNDAPTALQNLAGCWGDRTGMMETGWDDLPVWEWDVSRAVASEAGQSGHVSLALYSADSEYHTGKQFVTPSDFPDWGDASQRPTLEVVIADRE